MDHLLLFSFVAVLIAAAAVGSHATLPSEDYWNTMLPNTPMPAAIRDLIRPDAIYEKAGMSVGVGVGVDHPGKGGLSVDVGHKGSPVVVRVTPRSPFFFNYTASADQVRGDPTVTLFFLEKDFHPGAQMSLLFTKTTPAAFLPRMEAHAIPFSSDKLEEILHHFSVEPKSPEADAIMDTIHRCEAPGIKGEAQCCATSLESMIDFTVSVLGTHIRVLMTKVGKEALKQRYTIGSGVQKQVGTDSVTCHGQAYVYAVYLCHLTDARNVYVVPLIGEDGTRVDAVAVCHTDTSRWNPGHVAFQLLKVKPGSVPICHFLPQDHMVWAQN